MPTSHPAHFTPDELERRCVAPFVRRHLPFIPENARPQVAMVQPERTLIAFTADKRPASLPAQYSYIYAYHDGDIRQIVYLLVNANGDILRVLISK